MRSPLTASTSGLPPFRRKRRDHRAGFTLVEVLVAVAILALLAGAAIPVTTKVLRDGRISATKQEMAGLAKAIRAYGTDYGHAPSRLTWGRFPAEYPGGGAYPTILGLDLEQDVAGVGWDMAYRRGWNGPYIQGEDVTTDAAGLGTPVTVRSYQVDAWDRYYIYQNQGGTGTERTVTLLSGGPDRNPATAGDNLQVTVFRGPTY
jgi:prepilin-type N-terminal cleavage/methylation domain-containing protein